MHLILNLLEQLHLDHFSGGGSNALERINQPPQMEKGITPNRAEVFRRYNYCFKN